MKLTASRESLMQSEERVQIGLGSHITSVDVSVIDANSEALGVSRLQLMENAGRSVAEELAKRAERGSRIAVLAGPGGNGGDGLAAARHIAYMGYSVDVVLLAKPSEIRSPEARAMYEAVELMDTTMGLRVVRSPCDIDLHGYDAVVDALLGTGLKGAPRSPYAEAIDAINSADALKIAVDVPSGLNADTGETPGPCVKADVTVTFHKPKPGLLKRPDLVGELIVASIGAPPEAEVYVGPGDVLYRVPRRSWHTHKGQAGRVLVIGGSEDFIGAPIISALAAQRIGVDLVYIAAPSKVITAASKHPILIPVELKDAPRLSPGHVDTILRVAERVDSIVIGMGLGLNRDTQKAVKELLARIPKDKPVVLDADALKIVSDDRELIRHNMVLTPHEAEFHKVFGVKPASIEELPARIMDAVQQARLHSNVTIILKGPIDVITDGARARLNKTGAPAMSAGGTGDTLAGITGALLAKGLKPFDAACVAAYINGAAGALAYKKYGESMNAVDLIRHIHVVLNDPARVAKEALIYRRLPVKRTAMAV
ncbi:MAG TPA: NAD(P)H-hydrate dehydratase [Pyrodictium delaneyi]|uniref:Bifunctional NAD(P)H-hydrate repair enzyme n=1 Tax=Pyrodictium delaneyi TaxID=1273541 RepID=A0A833E8D4_9CREN|nr:NAD(P)H-hydrate dehydratase [Pyrodictium delaneyi]